MHDLDNTHDILSERGDLSELEAALKNASMSPQPSRATLARFTG